MNYQNKFQPKGPFSTRLNDQNVTHVHRRNVLQQLINDTRRRKDGTFAPHDLAKTALREHLVTYLSDYEAAHIDSAHNIVRESYQDGERWTKKGRTKGAKNRRQKYNYDNNYNQQTPFENDQAAVDALKELEQELDAAPQEQEPAKPEQFPAINQPLEKVNQADVKKQIAELFNEFLHRYGKDIDLIKADIKADTKNSIERWSETLLAKINELKNNMPVVVEIKHAELPNINMGIQHRNFPTLLKMCSARGRNNHHMNIWIYGPAGTGKSTAAEKVAEALSLDYYTDGKMVDDTKVLGYQDANGTYRTTNFRRAYENGGVYLADEIDGSMPDALLALNGALANGHCSFPDKLVKRHPDFIFLAAANTTGTGGTVEYVGRFKQDAAFNDRFVFLDWPIDLALEDSLCADKVWLTRVRTVRANLARSTIKGHLITPRAAIYGESLLAAGLSYPEVECQTLRKGLTDAQWNMIK